MDEIKAAIRLRVGSRVRQLRRDQQLTQEALAERVGNTWRHIGQIERGQSNVTIDVLTKLATRLSVDVSALFTPTSLSGVEVDPTAADTPSPQVTAADLDKIEEALRAALRAIGRARDTVGAAAGRGPAERV